MSQSQIQLKRIKKKRKLIKIIKILNNYYNYIIMKNRMSLYSYAYEFMGSFVIYTVGNCFSYLRNRDTVSLFLFGLVVAVLYGGFNYLLFKKKCGYFNFIIILGLFLIRKLKFKEFMYLFITQLTASIVSFIILYLAISNNLYNRYMYTKTNNTGNTQMSVFIFQIIFSVMICYSYYKFRKFNENTRIISSVAIFISYFITINLEHNNNLKINISRLIPNIIYFSDYENIGLILLSLIFSSSLTFFYIQNYLNPSIYADKNNVKLEESYIQNTNSINESEIKY